MVGKLTHVFRYPLIVLWIVCCSILFLVYDQAKGSHSPQDDCTPGPHSGTITANQTWCAADNPHRLSGKVTVAPGVTLTLESGVVTQAPAYPYDIGIVVQGTIESVGTAAQPIVLTSTDGGPTWAGLIVDGGKANLAFTTVEYACSDIRKANIAVINGGQLDMIDSILQECHFGGGAGERMLYIDSGTVTVRRTAFKGSDQYPIYIIGASSQILLTENVISGNAYDRILLAPGAMLGHDATLYPQAVWDGYTLEGSLTVPVNRTLTLEPGVVFKIAGYPYDMGIIVQGNLEAVGTASQPISLTSTDGGPTWAGVIVDGGKANLAFTTVEYACSDIRKSNIAVINRGHLEITDSLIQECHFGGGSGEEMLWIENGQANINSTTFKQSDGDYIDVKGDSTVLINASSIEGANEHGLLVEGDQALVQVTDSTILNNQLDGVRNTGAATVILSGAPENSNWIFFNGSYGANQTGTNGRILATHNWWGDATGPYHATLNPDGQGENVNDRVLFDPWRTDTTAPPSIDRFVWVTGDDKVSISGQYRNYGFYFTNVAAETLQGALLVADLPWEADYVSSTNGGIYMPMEHRVIWKLGDTPVGQSFMAMVQVYFKWGIPEGLSIRLMGLAAAENLPNLRVDYASLLAYQPITTLTEQNLNQAEVDAFLASDTQLEALFSHAIGQGFDYYGTATRRTLSDGSERIDLVLIDGSRPGELVFVRRIGDDRHIRHETNADLAIYDLDGGARFTFATSTWEFWGDYGTTTDTTSVPASTLPNYSTLYPNVEPIVGIQAIDPSQCRALSEGECLKNCLIQREPQKMTEGSLWGQSNCQKCVACTDPATCQSACSACALDLWKQDKDDGDYKDRCTYQCRDVLTRQNFKCTDNLVDCYPADRNGVWMNAEYRREYKCTNDCRYESLVPKLEYCRNGCSGATLGAASGGPCCEPASTWWGNQTCAIGTECPICDGVTCAPFPIIATVAHDPNAINGPEVAAPGQTIQYTIDTENVGTGTAYGVFVVAPLPAELDESTLVTSSGGVYFPGARQIFWDIGTLQPTGGAQVTFSAQLPIGTPGGTIIAAHAEVHFPSVPEITPTNTIFTIVGDVIAYPQEVQTGEGKPLAMQLNGYTVSGKPLTYEILRQPLNGTLTGLVPNLVYTPAANFEGTDSLSFRVTDGMQASQPAEVLIHVVTGAESIAPQVVFTSPEADESDVRVYPAPYDQNSYHPLIWAQFTEPLDQTTLTASTVYLTDPAGKKLAGEIVYYATMNRVRFVLHVPLALHTTYTLTFTTGVKDSSGNPMAGSFQWSFTTEVHLTRIYLPVVFHK